MTTRPTYCNPFWPGCFPDPFVLKVRGRYYAYATEGEDCPPDGSRVFPILASPDLVRWREVGKALPALGPPFFRYWAPEVTEHNGRFLLYYAVHTAPFEAAIRVAVAVRPEGPFRDSGHDLTHNLFAWAIDPHVFRDHYGQWYLYMTVEYTDATAGLIGSGNAVDRLLDPFTLEGRPARVTSPRFPWQLFEAQRAEKGGVDWYCVEGPAVLRHRGRYYEMFSAGCYHRDNYAVSYATSETPRGPGGLRDTSWHEWQPPGGDGLLIRSDPAYAIGPGHNSLVLGPNNADLYVAYHAWPPDMVERRPCLDRLFWHGDALWTAAPTHTPQPAPALPRVQELFDAGDSRPPPSWHVDGGRWSVADGAVAQEDPAASRATLYHRDHLDVMWLLEVNLRYVLGEGRYGILLHGERGQQARLAVEPAARCLVWSSGVPGEPDCPVALPAHYAPEAWHQLIARYAGSVLTVDVDGLPALQSVASGLHGRFALLSERCSAAFSAISLTHHCRDEFLDDHQTPATLGWYAMGSGGVQHDLSHWRVHDGALEQTDTSRGEYVLLKGPHHNGYEVGAAMRLLHSGTGTQPALGLVAWHSAEGMLLVWLVQGPPHCKLEVEGRGAAAGVVASLDLPPAFEVSAWHTIRLVRWGDEVTIYLDGPQVLTVMAPAGPGVLGVAARDGAAAFTGVWQTGLPPHVPL